MALRIEVSVENLEAGLERWSHLASSRKWARDLHAQLYERQANRRMQGLTPEWWHETVRDLSRWKANRPLSNKDIETAGRNVLSELDSAAGALESRNAVFGLVPWEELKPLFVVASAIKSTKSKSPVFASKLCHFMRPDLFTVVDNEIIGVRTSYPEYWSACSAAWASATNQHQDFESIVKEYLEGLGGSLEPSFPLPTKVTELCILGRRGV